MQYSKEQADIIRNPHSLWIEANAGSGKTFVLVNRVFFLLASGVNPENILCITFSNVASNEILHRVEKEILLWAKQDEFENRKRLQSILGFEPTDDILCRIKSLYLSISKLKITTIHSLCQDIISHFTQDLGLSKSYRIINNFDLNNLWHYLGHQDIIDIFIENVGDVGKVEYEFNQMIKNKKFVTKIKNFGDLIERLGFIKHLSADLVKILFPVMESSLIDGIKFLDDFFAKRKNFGFEELDSISGLVSDKYLIDNINNYYNNPTLSNYKLIFFTQSGEVRKSITNISSDHYLLDKINSEVHYIADTLVLLNQIKFSSVYNAAFIAVNEAYSAYKIDNSIIDYNDMIEMVGSLFNQESAKGWVYDRLGYDFSHVLVDEAQDTNSLQWEIIRQVTKNFATNMTVLGDKKQSIYYFQGTEPGIFDNKREFISSLMPVEEFAIVKSFRTNSLILKFIDDFLQCLGYKNIHHTTNREGAVGQVDFINVIKSEKSDYLDNIIVDIITKKVHKILSSKIALPSKNNRVVQPSDIVILLRKSTNNIDQKISQQLKLKYNIRAHSKKSLANILLINDLLVLGKFVCNPNDDLNLATILKGPLFSLSDEGLIAICVNREGSLWNRIIAYYPLYCEKLRKIINLYNCGFKIQPYQFFSSIWTIFKADFIKGKSCCNLGNAVDYSDIIHLFYDVCFQFEKNFPDLNLYDFIENFANYAEDVEVKSDPYAVQIMTIHKSKGSQAPIVIMGDFFRVNDVSVRNNYFFINKAGLFLHKCYSQNSLLIEHNNIELSESDRLLYVGMTRAEDYLVLINIEDDMNSNKYSRVAKNIIASRNKKNCDKFEKFLNLRKDSISFIGYRLGGLEKGLSEEKILEFASSDKGNLEEEFEFGSLIPKVTNFADCIDILYGAIFGKIIHKVFEVYPLGGLSRKKLIKKLLQENLGNDDDLGKVEGVIARLEKNHKLVDILAKSRSEVSIFGSLGGEKSKVYRIDKLYIDDDRVIIIDFKTDNIPVGKIPVSYLDQINNYKILMKKMYPKKEVVGLLVFLSNGLVYEVN